MGSCVKGAATKETAGQFNIFSFFAASYTLELPAASSNHWETDIFPELPVVVRVLIDQSFGLCLGALAIDLTATAIYH